MPAKCASPETVILNREIGKLSDGASENITIWRSGFLYQRASPNWPSSSVSRLSRLRAIIIKNQPATEKACLMEIARKLPTRRMRKRAAKVLSERTILKRS